MNINDNNNNNNKNYNNFSSKFKKLNFNLKKIIFSFLPIEVSFDSIISWDKSFAFALKKMKSFDLIMENQELKEMNNFESSFDNPSFDDLLMKIINKSKSYFETEEEAQNFCLRILDKTRIGITYFNYCNSQHSKKLEEIYMQFFYKSKIVEGISIFGLLDKKAIGSALKQNSSLKTITLEEAVIGNEGAKEIGKALELNTSLEKLYLYDNEIGDEGAIAI